MAQAFEIMMDPGRLAMKEISAARRAIPWIRFAFSSRHSPSCQRTRDCFRCHEEDVILDGLLPLSFSTRYQRQLRSRENVRNMICVETELAKHTILGRSWRRLCGYVLSLRMLFCQVTWVCTLWVTGHEFAFHSMQTRRWSPGRNGSSTHVTCCLAVHEVLMLAITGKFLLETVCNPLLLIPT